MSEVPNYYQYINHFKKNPNLLEKLKSHYCWEDCMVEGQGLYYKNTPRFENDPKWEPVEKSEIIKVFPTLESLELK